MLQFLPLAAAAISAFGSYKGQASANETNIQLAKENRDWQTEMSNTSYQRAVGDLQKAGLNPMLAYQQGGASTPAGGFARVENAIGPAMSSAQQTSQTYSASVQAQQNQAMTEQIKAQTDKIRSETMLHEVNAAKLAAEVRQLQFLGDKTAGEAEVSDVAGKGAHRDYEARVKHGSWEQDALTRRAQSGLAQLQELKEGQSFSADVARRRADAIGKIYGLDEQKAGSQFYETVEDAPFWVKTLLQVLQGASSARALSR